MTRFTQDAPKGEGERESRSSRYFASGARIEHQQQNKNRFVQKKRCWQKMANEIAQIECTQRVWQCKLTDCSVTVATENRHPEECK